MSNLILTNNQLGKLSVQYGRTEVQADLTVKIGLRATVRGSSDVSANMTGGYALLFINGKTTVSASLQVNRSLAATIEGSTQVAAPLLVVNTESFSLSFHFDILPSGLVPNRNWVPRLLVDGVEIPVVRGTFSESVDSSGGELQVTLARLSDKALMVPGVSIDFGFGYKTAGVWVEAEFVHKINDGVLTGTSESVGAEGLRWADTFIIKTKSNLQNKLDTTPLTDVVFYDSGVQQLVQTDFEVLYDTEGNPYVTELVPYNGLTLYDLFQEVFVDRMGFSGFETNLPDWNLTRVDCPIGQSYIQSIRGFFGMFNPVIYEHTNKVWIIDTTLSLPSGFPSPRELPVQNYRTLSINEEFRDIDGILVHYIENARFYDFVTIRYDTYTEEAGDPADSSYTQTDVEVAYREYRKLSQPGIVIKEELYEESRYTYDYLGTQISRTIEKKYFNQLGQAYRRDLDKWDLMPNVNLPGSMTLLKSQEERELWTYKTHPYQTRKQYMHRHELRTKGLVTVDSSRQQMGSDFRQEYTLANVAGNLNEDQVTEFVPIRTQFEVYRPQQNGQVKIQEFEIYHPTSSLIKNGPSQESPGDVAISSFGPQQKRVLVMESSISSPTGKRIERMHGGELPVSYLVPLARRKLLQAQSAGREGAALYIGHDLKIRKGAIFSLTGRTPTGGTKEVYGNFMVLGYSVTFDQTGVSTNLSCRELVESGTYSFSPENPVGSFTYSIDSSGVITFTSDIECKTGYYLLSTTVASLTIEARKGGVGSWTNIETTPIDLSADNGTIQSYQFRVSAAAVTSLTSRTFTILVEPL